MGLFHKRQKNIILCDSKRSSFITDFFELQFDTATLIIQGFRMIKARGCKQRFKCNQLYVITWYLPGPGFTCSIIIQYQVV